MEFHLSKFVNEEIVRYTSCLEAKPINCSFHNFVSQDLSREQVVYFHTSVYQGNNINRCVFPGKFFRIESVISLFMYFLFM